MCFVKFLLPLKAVRSDIHYGKSYFAAVHYRAAA